MRIEKVLVLPNPEKPAALACCEKIVSDLRSWGCSADYIPIGEGLHDKITACSPELMVVLGGDGSIIDVARCSAGMDIWRRSTTTARRSLKRSLRAGITSRRE